MVWITLYSHAVDATESRLQGTETHAVAGGASAPGRRAAGSRVATTPGTRGAGQKTPRSDVALSEVAP